MTGSGRLHVTSDTASKTLLVGDASAAAVLTLSAIRGGSRQDWKQIALYEIDGDKIVGMWFIEEEAQPLQ